MSSPIPNLLITRPGDLARLGLTWQHAEIAVDDGGPVLVAGNGATITMVLPPQSFAEQATNGAGADSAASLSGPSRLCFALAAGARLPLTPDGLLAALTGGRLVAATSTGDTSGTLLDMPANLISTTEEGVIALSTAAPRAPSGGVGLAQIDLKGPAGQAMLRALAANPDQPGLPAPALTVADRQLIVDAGAPFSATIGLSALGVTLEADLVTDAISWNHRTALGRDQDVVIVEKGVLYPLGHRATKVTTIRRTIAADGAPAALDKHQQIIVTEPVRSSQRQDFRFSHVEMLTKRLEFAQAVDEQKRPIPPNLTATQQQELVDLDQRASAAMTAADDALALYQGGIEALSLAGYEACREYSILQAERQQLQAEIDEPSYSLDAAAIAAHRLRIKAIDARCGVIWPQVQQDLASAKQQMLDARAFYKSLVQEYRDKQAEIQAINDATSNPPVIAFLPGDQGNQPLKFDVRMATPGGALTVQMPAIFVHDIVQPATQYLPDYTSLTDSSTIATLRQLWAKDNRNEVDVPGIAFDLVQAAVPEAGDVHEIYKLAIEAAGVVQTYLPRIARIDAKIASLRALLPGKDELTSLVYNIGVDAELSPLKPIIPIVVDFLKNADRSGGLVAPKFSADALSRTLGPAASAALDAAHLPDFTQLYKDARLLGLSLGEIIDTARQGIAIPNGPTIVPILQGIKPVGVKMTWKDLPLKAAGIFRPLVAGEPCYLNLEAKISGADTVTTATIHNAALALPPGKALVTIGFRLLEMVQQAGKPPAVNAREFSFALANELQLLDKLQKAVLDFIGIRDPGIVVRRTDDGVAAGYAFALPEVASGVFLMRNMGVSIDVGIPFNGNPVTIALGFARADNPFALAVTIFGGGGYFLIRMSRDTIDGIELSLTFGAFVAVSFVVAKGEVHAYGSITLKITDGKADFIATIKLGGSVDVLGIVSVSIELTLMLEYKSEVNRLEGEATLVIEVHVLFFSRSVKLSSGKWVIAGSDRGAAHRLAAGVGDPVPVDPATAQTIWNNYWGAYTTWTP